MPDLPYTDADLRAEAARQHSQLAEDPDFMSIGERMEYAIVESTITDPDPDETTGTTWRQLLPHGADNGEAYNAAQRKIDDLISGAADVSEYAVDLAAESLRPELHRVLETEDGNTFAAFHVALDPHCELSPQTYDAIADIIRADIAFRS